MACDAQEMSACNRLGLMYYEGHGVKQDREKAVLLYRKACEHGYMLSCNNLGVVYNNGDDSTKDLQQAIHLYQQACDGNEALGCYNLANLYRTDKDAYRNSFKAQSLYAQACVLHHQQSCALARDINTLISRHLNKMFDTAKTQYQQGNTKSALRLFQFACQHQQLEACDELTKIYQRHSDEIQPTLTN